MDPNNDQDGGQENAPVWASIPDEGVRGLMETKGYDSYDKLATAYSHLNKLAKGSPDVVALPGADADEKALGEFYTRLGRPADANSYEIKLPDGAQIDEGFMGTAKGWFHEAGLTSKQANALANKWQEYMSTRVAEDAATTKRTNEAAIAEINKKFGAQADAIKGRGQNAIKALGLSQEALDNLEKSIGAPAVVELFAVLGEKIGKEDVRIEGIGADGMGMSQAQAKAEELSLRNNKDFVDSLFNKQHPAHASNLARWNRIIAISSGAAAA